MNLSEILKQIGLNEKETQVYIATLQLGQDTAFNIAIKSQVKRATTYLVLESLTQKGLISILKTAKATFYIANNPNKLLKNLQEQEELLVDSMPSLQSIYNARPQKPKVQFFSGINGMSIIYKEIIDYSKTQQEILCLGTLTHFYLGPREFVRHLNEWIKITAQYKTKVREIINFGNHENEYVKKIHELKNHCHKIKQINTKLSFANDNIIYGNKIALFSTQNDFFVILIESKQITQTYKAFFNTLWEKI